MEAFPNVYADMSDQSIPVSEAYVAFVKQRLDAHPGCRARALYGSDWFMDELEPGAGYSTKDYLPFMRLRMAAVLYPDDAESFLAYNALTFLGFSTMPVDRTEVTRTSRDSQRSMVTIRDRPGSVASDRGRARRAEMRRARRGAEPGGIDGRHGLPRQPCLDLGHARRAAHVPALVRPLARANVATDGLLGPHAPGVDRP